MKQFIHGIVDLVKNKDSYENTMRHFVASQIIFNFLKLVSFVGLAFVSLNFSMDLFREMGSTERETLFFVLAVLGLESSKIISLVLAKSEFHTGKFKNVMTGVGFFILFLGLAFVSIFSSYGFILVSTEKSVKENIAMSVDKDVEFIQGKIEVLTEKIDSYLPQLKRSDLAIASKEKLEKQMSLWEEERDALYTEMRTLEKDILLQESKQDAVGMFTLMARDMNIEEKKLRFWMMFILVLVIELCITVMSPYINLIKPEKKEIVEEIPILPTPPLPSTPKKEGTLKEKASKVKRQEVIEPPVEKEETPPLVEVQIEGLKEVPVEIEEVVEEKPEVEEIIEVKKRETSFEKFLEALFNNKTYTWVKDKEDIAKETGLPLNKVNQYHARLAKLRGPSGYPFLEFRKNTGKWYPNYTEKVILNLYKEGLLQPSEGEAHAS